VSALPIVKHLNVLKNCSPSLLACLELVLVNELYFDGAKETFGSCATSKACASATPHLMFLQQVLKIMAAILDSMVAMMNQPFGWSVAIHGIG